MEIYATVTEWDSKAPSLQKQTGLYHIDFDKKLITRFVTFQRANNSIGFTGLTYDTNYVYLASQGNPEQSLITKVHRKEFTIATVFAPLGIRKITQLDILDGILWVGSGDSSELIALRASDAAELGRFEVDSSLGSPQSFRVLANKIIITFARSLIHVSWRKSVDSIEFGAPEVKAVQVNGDVSNCQPLADGGSVILDRTNKSIVIDDKAIELNGTPRGIAYDASNIYVGVSNRSPARAAIARVSRSSLKVEEYMNLPESGEIFDLRLTYVTDYGMSQTPLTLRSGIVVERVNEEVKLAEPIPMLDKSKFVVRV